MTEIARVTEIRLTEMNIPYATCCGHLVYEHESFDADGMSVDPYDGSAVAHFVCPTECRNRKCPLYPGEYEPVAMNTESHSEAESPEEIEQACVDLIKLLTVQEDIFSTDYCGYWLFGVDQFKFPENAWVVREDDPQDVEYTVAELNAFDSKICESSSLPSVLPVGYFVINKAMARKIIASGEKEYGSDFCSDYDNEMLDYAVQMALLGENRYG